MFSILFLHFKSFTFFLYFTECPYGRFGLNCKQLCPSGYYGRLCKSICECNASECHHVTGCETTNGTFSPRMFTVLLTLLDASIYKVFLYNRKVYNERKEMIK